MAVCFTYDPALGNEKTINAESRQYIGITEQNMKKWINHDLLLLSVIIWKMKNR